MALFRMKPWYRKKAKELSYYGTTTALSAGRGNLAATSVGNYALFGGGRGSVDESTVDAYDTSLVRTVPGILTVARYDLAATSVGNYALFGGGYSNNYFNIVDAYKVA